MRASIVGTTVLAAVAAALVLPATDASANGDKEAPEIKSVSAPSIVGMTAKGAVFNVDVKVADNIDVASVVVGVVDNAGKVGKGFAAGLSKGMSWDGIYTAKVTMPITVPLGGWKVSAFAEDNAGNRSSGVKDVRDTFTLKYATRITKLNAGPEPVAKGATMIVTGNLQQTVKGGWASYAGKAVKVRFRKVGTSTWVTVGSPISAASGKFSMLTKATAAGDWRAVYAGDAAKAKTISKADAVALER